MEETKELNKIEPEKVTMMIHGKEREIKFNFSAWRDIEKEYNGFNNFEKVITEDLTNKPFETLPHLLYKGLKDKEGVSEENILDDYTLQDMEYIISVFNKALYGSLPQEDDTKKEVVMEA